MRSKGNLLIVDDDELNRDVLSRRLENSGYQVETAADGAQALELVAARAFDLILLDQVMPGLTGLEVVERLRRQYSESELPVIMVTAQQESEHVVRALRRGANDYITKPIDFPVARARIEAQISRRSALALQRTLDPATSLPNRAWLEEQLRERAGAGRACAVLVFEPDRLDRAEQSLAPEIAAHVLVAIAGRLRDLSYDLPALLARCGDYQFALLLDDEGAAARLPAVAERVRAAFEQPLPAEGEFLFVVPVMGMARSCGDQSDLLRDAHSALRHAREQARGCQMFAPHMREHDLESLRLENDLRMAVEREEWVVHYQPKLHLATGRIDGFEALVRWNRPAHGLVMPSGFIESAERTGLIVRMGKQILHRACRDTVRLRESFPRLTVSVNVSGREFAESRLPDQIREALETSGLPPSALRLEVTETTVMANPEMARLLLEQLRALGVGLKLDDFGSGYASLAYLHQFPFDTLKIDRSFVSRLDADEESTAIVRAILAMAQTLQMSVVAEGIETWKQLDILKRLGCPYGQGYWFSPPVDLERLETLLAVWLPPGGPSLPGSTPEEPWQNCY